MGNLGNSKSVHVNLLCWFSSITWPKSLIERTVPFSLYLAQLISLISVMMAKIKFKKEIESLSAKSGIQLPLFCFDLRQRWIVVLGCFFLHSVVWIWSLWVFWSLLFLWSQQETQRLLSEPGNVLFPAPPRRCMYYLKLEACLGLNEHCFLVVWLLFYVVFVLV